MESKSRTSRISLITADLLPDEIQTKIQYQQYLFGFDPFYDNDNLRNQRGQSFFKNTLVKTYSKFLHTIERSLSKMI